MVSRRERSLLVVLALGTALLASWWVARGVTRIAAAHWLPLEPIEGEPPLPAASGTGKIPTASSATSDAADPMPILQRNIFDPELGDLTASQSEEGAEEEAVQEPTETPPIGGDLPVCEGSMRLVGTAYRRRHPEQSLAAVIGVSGKAKLYRVGHEVDGRRILAIGRDRIVLQQDSGGACQLQMFTGQPSRAAKGAAGGRIRIARAEEHKDRGKAGGRVGGVESAELDRGITRVSDTRFAIERSLVDKLLSNQAELMRAARIIPHQRGGRVVGVKLYGIRRGSLLSRLGLQNGDLLRTINGFDMSSPDKALEAYTKLRTASNLTVAIERRGQSMTLDYEIR